MNRLFRPLWCVVAATVCVLLASGSAWAYFTASGSVSGSATGDALPTGATPTTSVAGSTVTVSFALTKTTGTSTAATGYTVKRYSAATGGTGAAVACTVNIGATSATCADTPATGTWYYSDTPLLNNWSGAESTRSAATAVQVVGSLTITTQPSSVKSGAAMTPSVVVLVKDTANAVMSGASVAMAIGTNAASGTLGGTLTQSTNASGNATFNDLTVDKAGNGYTLIASSGGVSSNPSSTFDVTAAKFGVSATSPQTAGTAFTVTVTAQNADGTTATNYTGPKTLTFSGPGSSPTGTAPTYPSSVNFTNGVVSGPVTLTKAETTALAVSDAASISGTSGVIVVNAGAPNRLAWTNFAISGGSGTATLSGSCFYTCVYNSTGGKNAVFTAKVMLTDSLGNTTNATSQTTVTVSVPKNGGGSFTGSAVVTIASGASTSSSGGSDGTGKISFTTDSAASDTIQMTSSPSYTGATATFNK